jgi:hypothetical protein
VGPGSSGKVLVPNVEYVYLGTSLCRFVLRTQKMTSSQNKKPASDNNKLHSHLGGGSFYSLLVILFFK